MLGSSIQYEFSGGVIVRKQKDSKILGGFATSADPVEAPGAFWCILVQLGASWCILGQFGAFESILLRS